MTKTMDSYPLIVTPPPGPKARAVISRDKEWTSTSYIKEYPLVIATGRGAMVEDVDGNRYIDWMAGIAVSTTGYNHPRVVAAVQQQAGRFLHMCGTDFYYEGMASLCEKLGRAMPGDGNKRVFLTNSGTEAVEGAVKLARYHTKRPYVIAFEGAFHGRSYAGMSLSASKVKYRAGFAPLLPGIVHVPFDNPYRKPMDWSRVDDLFGALVSPADVAAVIMEPIQGEGGYVVPGPDFLARWRELCDRHGILLIFDEIQSGMGRTGKMWACEHDGVAPDILLTAKGLGSGLPIGAIIAREEIMTWPRGSHGTTFGGNPVACAAALTTLELLNEGLIANATRMGERLILGLRALQAKHPRIGDVRGRGLMIGVEFVMDPATKEPDGDLAHALEQLAFTKGLLLLGCGKSVIRVAPPLVLDEHDVDTGLQIVDECLDELGA